MTDFLRCEWVAIAYFLYLMVSAATVRSPMPASRRVRVVMIAFMLIVLIGAVATLDVAWAHQARLWLPLLYLVAAYWLPSKLVVAPNCTFEQTLASWDRKSVGLPLSRFRRRAPAVLELLELAYLFCYPLVPLGYFMLALNGYPPADVDRFWTTVLGAALPCYATLPWLPTRPPRALERVDEAPATVRGLNLRVLKSVSVGWNTFPSGHSAASIATALALAVRLPVAGLAFGVIAICICIGSVTGRYHYAPDAGAGIVLAVVAFVLVHAS